LIIWSKGVAEAIRLRVFKTALLKESRGWFPNMSSSEASPFFCVDKGKMMRYILYCKEALLGHCHSVCNNRSEKNLAKVSKKCLLNNGPVGCHAITKSKGPGLVFQEDTKYLFGRPAFLFFSQVEDL